MAVSLPLVLFLAWDCNFHVIQVIFNKWKGAGLLIFMRTSLRKDLLTQCYDTEKFPLQG